MSDQAYDFTAWQARLGLDNAQAAQALGVSKSFFLQLRRDGGGRKLYAWAAYGIECHAQAQKPEETAQCS